MSKAIALQLADHPTLRGLVLRETLRHRAGFHSVHLVQFKGRPAYLKLFEGRSPETQARAAIETASFAAEKLRRFAPDGDHAVAQILLACPDAGAVVFAPAPGQQLSLLLAEASSSRRNQLIARAGAWLAALTSPFEHTVFAPYFWLKPVHKAARQIDPQADPILIAKHLSALNQLAEALRGAVALRARSHGDFTPDNLFFDGRVMTAIDMHQQGTMPVARDLARFLVWLHSRRSKFPSRTMDGISIDDYNSLSVVFDLKPQNEILRFMMGALLAEVYLDSPGRISRRRLLAQAMVAWQGES